MFLYLHIAGDYDRVLENIFGVLESFGKGLEFVLGKTVETLSDDFAWVRMAVACNNK